MTGANASNLVDATVLKEEPVCDEDVLLLSLFFSVLPDFSDTRLGKWLGNDAYGDARAFFFSLLV